MLEVLGALGFRGRGLGLGAGDGCFTMGVGASVLSTSGGFRGFLIEGLGLKRCGVEGSTAHGRGKAAH